MITILLSVLLCELPCYSVSADPADLAYLYAHFEEDELEIPGVLHLDSLDVECTLAFRGGTALWCPKKSWHIRLEDESLLPSGGHVLLNAQFRDPSLMRNTLGMYMTRSLGHPAPLTSFVTYEINGDNMGVYEQVERIDRLFYQRNGMGFGPLFKNVDTMGRIACQYADTTGLAGLEPKIDSQPYGFMVLKLIEDTFRGDVTPWNRDELIAAFAVNTAIADKDGLIKNFYLHHYSGQWHYYPWDRDATFGNSWEGVYNPEWQEEPSLIDIGYFGAARGLLEDPACITILNQYVQQCSQVMGEEMPLMVDSLNLLLRDELASDPYYPYSTQQFDSLCQTLRSDLMQRASFLAQFELDSPAPPILSYQIADCLDLDEELEVSVTLGSEDAIGVVMLVSLNGGEQAWHYMEPAEEDNTWEREIDLDDSVHTVSIAFGPRTSPHFMTIFYPSWSMRGFGSRPSPVPTARTALAGLEPSQLVPGTPVWYGDDLWAVPVVNSLPAAQDLSYCGFRLGDPSGTIFLHDSVLIEGGETFYLASNADLARPFLQGHVFGDAGTAFPVNTQLALFDPAWHDIHSWQLGPGDSLPPATPDVIPCEISMGSGPDWIELYNRGSGEADLSSWYLMDSESNVSWIPEGTLLAPGHLLVAWEDPPLSRSGTDQVELTLDFALDAEEDSISLYTREGSRVFSIGWNDSWPSAQTGMIYLQFPMLNVNLASSWIPEEPPGSPGEANPGWQGLFEETSVSLCSANPCGGAFSFSYCCTSLPIEASIFDLAGRRIASVDLPHRLSGTVTADFTGSLPSGVYIICLRSSTGMDSVKLTVLAEE